MSGERNGPPWRVPAIWMEQPIGFFCIASVPSDLVCKVTYRNPLEVSKTGGGSGYQLSGTQRALQDEKAKQIAEYLKTEDCTIPNSIILAANYRPEDGEIEKSPERMWRFEPATDADSTVGFLVIPTEEKLARIIDGQHRIRGFEFAGDEVQPMSLCCSVFLNITQPYQAYLFAIINSTQKKVDKSLTYELFGYNLEDEQEESWSPDKLAVYLARRLNTEEDSPLKDRIVVAASSDDFYTAREARREGRWVVSMAPVVEGIGHLFSSNMLLDAYHMKHRRPYSREVLAVGGKKAPPLRRLYIECNDLVIYKCVKNFFRVADRLFFAEASRDSFITRTVGMQALFDVLKLVASIGVRRKDFSEEFFSQQLEPAGELDFSQEAFQQASGIGKVRIRDAILEKCDIGTMQ